MKKNLLLAALLSVALVPVANAASHKGQLETCLKAVLAKYPGQINSLEAEIENKIDSK